MILALFYIIYLIHKWGGVTGRYFIMNRRGEGYFERFKKDKDLINIYINAAKMSMKGDPNSINEFCKIAGIAESFASKHAYFWSCAKSPLIIVDRLLASYFGFRSPIALIRSLEGGYAQLLEIFSSECKKRKLESVLILERGIFQYMREQSR